MADFLWLEPLDKGCGKMKGFSKFRKIHVHVLVKNIRK